MPRLDHCTLEELQRLREVAQEAIDGNEQRTREDMVRQIRLENDIALLDQEIAYRELLRVPQHQTNEVLV